MVLDHDGPQCPYREDGALPAQDGHVATAEHVLHVEGGELGALPGDQELADQALALRVVDAVDRRDAAHAGVRDDLGLELLHGVGSQGGVAVHAEEVVGLADDREAVVQGADLLVRVLTDVVDVDLGGLARLTVLRLALRGPGPGELRRQLEGVVLGVVDDHVDLVRQPGLLEQRAQHHLDRPGLVVGGYHGGDGGPVGRQRVHIGLELADVGGELRLGSDGARSDGVGSQQPRSWSPLRDPGWRRS